MKHLLGITFLIFTLVNCAYNSEEELYSANSCDTVLINYEKVQPIFIANCVTCHNLSFNNKQIILDNYANAVNAAQTGQLIKAVNHRPGATPMPYGLAKLPDCEVLKITMWIEKGTPQ